MFIFKIFIQMVKVEQIWLQPNLKIFIFWDIEGMLQKCKERDIGVQHAWNSVPTIYWWECIRGMGRMSEHGSKSACSTCLPSFEFPQLVRVWSHRSSDMQLMMISSALLRGCTVFLNRFQSSKLMASRPNELNYFKASFCKKKCLLLPPFQITRHLKNLGESKQS